MKTRDTTETGGNPATPAGRRIRQGLRAILALAAGLPLGSPLRAGELTYFQYRLEDSRLILELPANNARYYILDETGDFSLWSPVGMTLAFEPPAWTIDLADPADDLAFWRVRSVSVFGPPDTDGDGIDDVFELEHPILNPLDPTDAELDPDGNGLTFLQEYRQLFGRDLPDGEVYGREVSLFNFGAPTARFEAMSREISVFNGESPPLVDIFETYGREVSVYNFGSPPGGRITAESREVSVFNFGEPTAPLEAISRELSVFNGESPVRVDIPEVYSRELSVFNFGEPSARIEAISREVSLFNNTL